MPANRVASDFLARHGEHCSIRFVALNPRRRLCVRDDGIIAADSAFLAAHPVTSNLQARALFKFDAACDSVEAPALSVHEARDHREAELLLGLLDPLLDRPAPPTT
ncbi:MAG: hypothetical protein R3F29_04955 [Planctomycetota bacterium]